MIEVNALLQFQFKMITDDGGKNSVPHVMQILIYA